MKAMHKVVALLLAVLMITASIGGAFAADDGYASTYTYNYDYWSDIRESPDAYHVVDVVYSTELGLDKDMKRPQSLFVRGNDLYVVDSGNNRILQLTREGNSLTFKRSIDAIQGSNVNTLNNPNDVYVDENNNIYICDTNNNRIVMVDENLNYLKEFVKPSNAVFTVTQNNKETYKANEGAEGVASIVLPIGGYTIKEDSGPAKLEGYDLAIVGNEKVAFVKEHQATDHSVINLYSTREAYLDERKYTAPAPVFSAITEAEAALIAAAEQETGAPHGILRISVNAHGAQKPENITYTVTEAPVTTISRYFSDFRYGELSVAVPLGEFTVAQSLPAAKLPGFDTHIVGGDTVVWVRNDKAVTVEYLNLYTNEESKLDAANYSVAQSTHAELTGNEKQLVAAAEAKTGNAYGIVRLKASSLGAEIPSNTVFDQTFSFLPNKLVVDESGRVFALVKTVNKGIVKFEADVRFTGFIGANKVSHSMYDYIWKNYFMTEAQRAQQQSFVPTEYCNIYMDKDSFIYATNVVFSEYDLLWDVAQPIRRLNGIGNDILIKNDRYPPIGDLYWVEQNTHYGPSKFHDITVLDNDIYIGIDKTRGRIFGYDPQGFMLWAFGTSGNSEGGFTSAISIEHMGKDLIVLDEAACTLTLFTPTEYGNLIYDAYDAYMKGDYDGSSDLWSEVLKQNANYNLAFIGIGRALLRQDEYKEAMEYFKMAHDRENYGRAFRLYRKIWVEENVGWIVAALVVLMAVPLIRRQLRKMRMEVEIYERNQVTK